ncbi:SCO family protein [Thermomonas sp. S9]|uniref:SCO family protein n=1 Tax=Thermomonas sp. S9 TaxID=2885203 RepID=UPI00216AC8B0|nr:SCO family protein [Thermomonas sp. S9]MCR6495774.1 SCO family protein [Thermomonas sp. S9]
MNTPSIRRLLRGLAALVLLGLATAAGAAQPAASALPGDSIYQLPLPLTDSNGQTRDWRSLRGKPRLLAMFYTSCQYICPLIVESGKAVERELTRAQQKRLGVVPISMDPARDDPAALRKVIAQRRLDAARWTLATPRADDVRAVAGVLGIRYRQLADGGFNHSSALILVDPEGRIVARTEKIGGPPDPEFVAAVRKATGG